MRLYRDRAVVLRQHKLGEADRIVTLLTREHGLVRAVAKGVRRTRSKFGARLEPFAHIDVQLHPGRNLDIVTQVQAIDAFASDIVSDYGRYTCGCAVLETAERLAGEERAPVPALHRLTVGALRAVADGNRPRELVLDAYLLRAMGIAGWAPALIECARCAAPGPHRAFHVAAGGSVCVHCRPSGSVTPPQGVLDLMVALHDGDWEAAEASTSSHRSQASGLVAAHLQWHLERQLRTLPLVERVYRIDRTVAEHRVSLFGQDVAHGFEDGRPRTPTHSCLRRLTTIRRFPDKSTWPVVFPDLPPQDQRQVLPPAAAHVEGSRRRRSPQDQVPNHVAVVMDGNGRWATQRGLGRTEGHKMGEAVLIDITCGAIEIGIKHLTVYAFSTENWKRSTEEVRFLMGFNREVVRRRRENLNAMGVRMRWVGSRPRMWRSVIKEFDIAEQMTVGQRRHHHQLLRELRRPHRDRRGGTGTRAGGRRRKDQPRAGSARPRSPSTCTATTSPTSTCSSGRRGSSGRATSCCGRRRTPSSCSRTSCGPTTTAATCGRRARST